MFSTRKSAGQRPELRLFSADEPAASSTFLTREQRELIEREPRLLWTWRQFLENWFIDAVLKPKRAAAGTLDGYDNMLRYWEAITSNPPLILTPDDVCIDFVGTLPEWGWCCKGVRRGAQHRIGPIEQYPSYWPLATPTVKSHRDRLATLIRASGPRFDPSEPRARILREVPYVPIVTCEWEAKPPFTIAEAQQIAAAAGKMVRPELPAWITCELWWQTRLGLFYFTGLRAGTVTALAWRHVEERSGLTWLKVPGEIVKTGKPIEMPLHAQLAGLLAQVRGQGSGIRSQEDLILPSGCGYRHFLTLHSEIQEQAGLDEAQRQSPHAWRRTHGVQMNLLGAGDAREIARLALDHASGRTTQASYVGDIVVNQLRLRLPPLF